MKRVKNFGEVWVLNKIIFIVLHYNVVSLMTGLREVVDWNHC